jgi:hypothetical protein
MRRRHGEVKLEGVGSKEDGRPTSWLLECVLEMEILTMDTGERDGGLPWCLERSSWRKTWPRAVVDSLGLSRQRSWWQTSVSV